MLLYKQKVYFVAKVDAGSMFLGLLYGYKNLKEGVVMGLGMDMERDELLEDRAAFIAGEIGGAVVELIIGRVVINRDAIVDSLEAKRKAVGNVIHKGLLRDAAEFVRKGQ